MYKDSESGNALIYVLIAIVLFAALGFTLSRQNSNTSTKEIDDAKKELFATQIITYATQTKSVIDQMSFTGTDFDEFDFTKPNESGFNTAPNIHKIYHPQGGGLSLSNLPEGAKDDSITNPDAGYYLGLYNNIEWTPSIENDILFTAYGIKKSICAAINQSISGDSTIPQISGNLDDYFTDEGSAEITESACAECEGYPTLCVSNTAGNEFAFYALMLDR